MFRLDSAMESWKQQFQQHQTMTDTDIAELQSHILEEMDALMATGLNQEEAFLIASRRIGNPTDISCEFAKINSLVIWKNRFFWMITGVLTLRLFSTFATFLAHGGTLLECQQIGWDPIHTGIVSAVIQIAVSLGLIAAFYWVAVRTSFFRTIRKQTLISIFIALSILSIPINFVTEMGFRTLIARMYSLEQLGQFSLGCTYSSIGLSILFPVAWLVLMLVLLPGKTRPV